MSPNKSLPLLFELRLLESELEQEGRGLLSFIQILIFKGAMQIHVLTDSCLYNKCLT